MGIFAQNYVILLTWSCQWQRCRDIQIHAWESEEINTGQRKRTSWDYMSVLGNTELKFYKEYDNQHLMLSGHTDKTLITHSVHQKRQQGYFPGIRKGQSNGMNYSLLPSFLAWPGLPHSNSELLWDRDNKCDHSERGKSTLWASP